MRVYVSFFKLQHWQIYAHNLALYRDQYSDNRAVHTGGNDIS